MPNYNPDLHHRRSIRLSGYDYSQNGLYFVTICTHNREYLFGDIRDGEMHLNDAGKMIQRVWDEIPIYYPSIGIEQFIVMPNHIHGIIAIHDMPPPRLSLPEVVQRFKTMTTKQYTDGVKYHHWQSFSGKLWQRNYWEHIIRTEQSQREIATYIITNPAQWETDTLHT
jgi:REP element-mobilizing transposase RayT